MRESGGPRHLGLEGQDDPSKTIWRSLAQLKASVESLDPVALSKKYTGCAVHGIIAEHQHLCEELQKRVSTKTFSAEGYNF